MMSMYLSFIRCFARFNGYKSGNTRKLKIPFICEDSERIPLKYDFFFHWHFTEKPLKDFDFNN